MTFFVPRRLRFRPSPPQSFYAVYERATTQRFYVLSRTRCGTDECPEEMLELAGSTGNVYIIVIAREPSCDCPHARAGNQCKHLVYVLSRVLRAPFEYTYQLAFLASELRDIFANAPVPPADDRAAEEQGKRKAVEGDCPICFGEMHPGDREAVVWCRAACGQNIHKECFEMWASTKRGHGGGGGDAAAANVTCPFCRSVWKGDEDMVKKIKTTGKVNAEGYVSVADQLGMSTERGQLSLFSAPTTVYPFLTSYADTSTYSQWWSGHDKGRRGYRSYYYEDEDEW